MQKKGRFIVVEGLEGAGKSTALDTINQFLTPLVGALIMTREPGGTPVGEAIRHVIKDVAPINPMDARTELLLLYASRMELVKQVIRPALASGSWVIGDRFELSTWAYQGGGRQLSQEMIRQLSLFCLEGFEPDLILFLDIDPEEGLERALKRGAPDRFEQEELSFFTKVYRAYHERIKAMKNVVVIEAGHSLAEVQCAIREVLSAYILQHPIDART